MTLTATDFFCGMGGSSTGLVGAGYDVKVAANHWGVAIETHAANHPETEHLHADISNIDLRYLPKTDLLWASPICTEVSPAGGRRRRGHQLDLFEEFGHVPSEAFERTRVTFWEVIRACEIHRYKAVLIENVVEAAHWELFDVWLSAMNTLGYEHQFVSVSAAHIGDESNPHAPQWRDRLYIGFVRKGIKMPDLQPRPWAWCENCGDNVQAIQAWKREGRRIGKYGPQYVYVCPEPHADGIVEPYVVPASAAIDWTDLGTRIGDRESLGMRPLSKSTMKRIQLGLDTIADPALIAAGGNTWDGASGAKNNYLRAWPLDQSPTPAQVTAIQNGIAMSGKFITSVNHGARGIGRHFDPDTRPLPTSTVKEGKGLVLAPGAFTFTMAHGGRRAPIDVTRSPAATHTTAQTEGLAITPELANQDLEAMFERRLVIPYRKGGRPYPENSGPVSTQATKTQHGLLDPGVDINDCYFRMLTPREAANAQAFPREYVIHGNKGEQQMQAGNAVAVNVAHELGKRMAAVL